MTVTRDFEYTMHDKIYRLCNQKRYFTCGTNSQYELMFRMSTDQDFSPRDVAVLIYGCSDDADLGTIQRQIEEIWNEILEFEAAVRLEERIAQGERDADEAYCAQFD